MIETVVKIISLWAILSILTVAIAPIGLKPASILLTQSLKRHKSGLQLMLK